MWKYHKKHFYLWYFQSSWQEKVKTHHRKIYSYEISSTTLHPPEKPRKTFKLDPPKLLPFTPHHGTISSVTFLHFCNGQMDITQQETSRIILTKNWFKKINTDPSQFCQLRLKGFGSATQHGLECKMQKDDGFYPSLQFPWQ